ncbi:MAG: glycosyltransferase family 2 protein [Chitinophagaceae bacterium]|nr:MAG: glycosyltransferase family 2 protein [Chitinophagaceae bacterium]
MFTVKLLFFAGILVIFYSYAGYGILLYFLLRIKWMFSGKSKGFDSSFEPHVTLVIAAYNEEDFIRRKIENSLALEYPKGKLELLFISDGSSDRTAEIISGYASIRHLHVPERNGKVAAMHRAMEHIRTPYVVFSDANTLLNTASIRNIVRHYSDGKVGGVAGEKKIIQSGSGDAAEAGEGLYWRYESFLKKLDSDYYTVVGAAGELFSVKRELYENPGADIILDDFVISLKICKKGYRVAYEPDAYAMETSSSSIAEERKRKIRISAGAFQSMVLLSPLLNIFKYGTLSFQYISHRVLRWTLCPLFLPIVLLTNIILSIYEGGWFYHTVLAGQLLFYLLAFGGKLMQGRKNKISFLQFPYYFFFINYSIYLGFIRYTKGKQSVLWEKAARAGHMDTTVQ